MIYGCLHDGLDEPPTSSMLKGAGKSDSSNKIGEKFTMSEAFTHVAMVISSVLSPKATNQTMSSQVVLSPAKLIDSRSKCYKQLSELTHFKDTGILTICGGICG